MSKATPKVSVVIPYSSNYTPKRYLREAIESANSQSIETNVIVINDLNNRGPAWARNEGIKRADHNYIAFLDADDVWLKGKLKRQIRRMRGSNTGICVEGKDRSKNQFIIDVLAGRISGLTSSILIDRRINNVQFDESITRKEDHLFIIESAIKYGISFCPNLTKIRKHDKGLSSQNDIEMRKNAYSELDSKLRSQFDFPNEYHQVLWSEYHYSQARDYYKQNKQYDSMRHFYKSLKYKIRVKTLIGMLITLINKKR